MGEGKEVSLEHFRSFIFLDLFQERGSNQATS